MQLPTELTDLIKGTKMVSGLNIFIDSTEVTGINVENVILLIR